MSEHAGPQGTTPSEDAAAEAEATESDVSGQVETLERENRRLRRAYARQQRSEYRRAALALAGVGGVALTAAALFPAVRSVLIVVGAIGVFGGVLTRYLTPERFVSADVGERVVSALADNEAAVAAALGLQADRVYVAVDGPEPARLFVPQHREYAVPDLEALAGTLVIPDDPAQRGLALRPTGGALYQEFQRTTSGDPPTAPDTLVDHLAEAVVETFEIAERAEATVDVADGRATVDITSGVFGGGDVFDTPAASLVAVGLAATLETPLQSEVTPTDDGFTVSCLWDPDAVADGVTTASGTDTTTEESAE